MSGTISRVSSAFLRQQRPFNLRKQPNYASTSQEAAKKAAQGATQGIKNQFNTMTAGKSREEIVGWVFLGFIGIEILRLTVKVFKKATGSGSKK